MRIGEVAARSGVSTRALRYYDEQQLLPAVRSPSGQRHYPDSAVDRVQLIQQLYRAGLGSKAVAELLPCLHTGIATPPMLTRVTAERDRIAAQARALADTRDRLDAVIATATATTTAASAAELCSQPGPGPVAASTTTTSAPEQVEAGSPVTP